MIGDPSYNGGVQTEKTLLSYASLTSKEVLKELNTPSDGLTHSEVEKRIRIYGMNVLSEEKKRVLLLEFIATFRNPLVLILLVAAFVSFGTGEALNGGIIT